MQLYLVWREMTFTREGDLVGDTPDQPVLVSLEWVSGPQIPTKSYFTTNPKCPYLSGQLIKNKAIVPQVVS